MRRRLRLRIVDEIASFYGVFWFHSYGGDTVKWIPTSSFHVMSLYRK